MSEDTPPDATTDPPRYAPDAPLPPYRYVPGVHPHPTRHAEGHARGAAARGSARLDEASWRTHAAWLLACDLYNHGYYWEAHEAWEDLWRAATDRRLRRLLQALILRAAARLKARMGDPATEARLAVRACVCAREAFDDGARARLGVPREVWPERGDRAPGAPDRADAPDVLVLRFDDAPAG